MWERGKEGLDALSGFDIQSSVPHQLLCLVFRMSSIRAKISLPPTSSSAGMGTSSPGMTTVPQLQASSQRLEQDLCRDQRRSRANSHPTALRAAAVPATVPAHVPMPPAKKQEPTPLFLEHRVALPSPGSLFSITAH